MIVRWQIALRIAIRALGLAAMLSLMFFTLTGHDKSCLTQQRCTREIHGGKKPKQQRLVGGNYLLNLAARECVVFGSPCT